MAEEIKTPVAQTVATGEIKKEEVTRPIAEAQPIATSVSMSITGHKAGSHPNDVVFEVKYAKDYKGTKAMPEGETVVSRELAEQFTQLGIGKVKA